MSLRFDLITRDDAASVAALHALSWKSAYRGILSDQFLDEQVERNRLSHWEHQLSTMHANSFGIIARAGDDDMGFAWIELDEDAVYGHLLDNLHVHPLRKAAGIGRALMGAISAEISARSVTRSLFLWVYEENHGARGFYDHLHGKAVERKLVTTLDNRNAWQWRYVWDDAVTTLRTP